MRFRLIITLYLVSSCIFCSAQVYSLDDIDSTYIHENGFYGYLYKPKEQKKLKPIIVLGGSDGGIKMKRETRDFALEGFAALNLAYFDFEDLPKYLSEIPIEYFEKPISWLLKQDYIESPSIAVFGFSRGAELALVLASEYSEISVVVSMAASNLCWGGWGGWGNDHDYAVDKRAAWTKSGKELPWMNIELDSLKCLNYSNNAEYIENEILNLDIAKQATVPIYKSNAAFLFISGSNDPIWPSSKMAENSISLLNKNNYSFPHEHLIISNQGHYINLKEATIDKKICWDYIIEFINENLNNNYDTK